MEPSHPDPSGPPPPEAPALEARALASLDWPRLLAHLADRAATVRGRASCLAAPLHDDLDSARAAQAETAEMMQVLSEEDVPLGGITDAAPTIDRARIGEVLTGRGLLEIAANADALQRLRRFLVGRADRAPRLARVAEALPQLSDLVSLLRSSFEASGELSTAAYPQLADLRAQKARLHAEITRRIDDLSRADEWAGLLQDDYSTVRGDRYVVPVKAHAKSFDLGIVHDTSGSGQTVYIEPKEVVALNNRLVVADAELRHEERRILADLSHAVGRCAGDLLDGLLLAARLDFVHARARLGRDLGATTPDLVAAPRLDARDARHPLLVLRGVDVVPNRLVLGQPHRALILSGPNTGGKTVTLKTLGLLALMARAGLPVPAAEGSVVGLFPRVLTDIGDTQSVESDLSTFSGHVRGLKEIFAALDLDGGGALVLLDEVAVGTDPRQGAALGRALLESLLDRGCLLATTTHYTELKALSAVDARFVNGRLEFDAGEMRPTWRLTLGHPGRSYALDVARRLGLPSDVLEGAARYVETQEKELEALLAEQERETRRAREQAALAERARAEAETEARRLREREKELRERERRLKEDVLGRFEAEVRGYRDVVRGVIRDLQAKPGMAGAERARERVDKGARGVRDRLGADAVPPPRPDGERIDWSRARAGDQVEVASLGKVVELAGLPDATGKVEVALGGARLRVAVQDLLPATSAGPAGPRPPGPRPDPNRAPRGGPAVSTADTALKTALRMPGNTLDLRGHRVDEALDRVFPFLDQAVLEGREVVFILHGHGTNALRNAIREALRTSSYVREYSPAADSQGGDAVTAVRVG